MTRAANREAIAHLEQALETLRHLPETRETTELTIDVHIDLRNALAVFRTARSRPRPLRRGDLPRAIRVLERGLELCRTWQFAGTSNVAATLGAAYALAGRADEALPLVAGAVEEFRSRQNHTRPALILLCAGLTYLSAGRIDEAAGYAREALALSRRLGARASEAHALCLAGDIASAGGAEDAEGYYQEALARAAELGMRPLIAHCHLGLGKLYRRTGGASALRSTSRPRRRCTATCRCACGWRRWRRK